MNMFEVLGPIVLDTRSLGGFSDDEFYQFCLDNSNLKFERDAESNIIVMANTGAKTCFYNHEINVELGIWNRARKMGICFDSSTAFKLPNGAVRSPDSAWVKIERWNALTEKEKEQFPPLCPEFVIEIKSSSDSLTTLKNKMEEWIANGSQLAWLINPEEKLSYIYSQANVATSSFEVPLSGKNVLKGLEIKLSEIFI